MRMRAPPHGGSSCALRNHHHQAAPPLPRCAAATSTSSLAAFPSFSAAAAAHSRRCAAAAPTTSGRKGPGTHVVRAALAQEEEAADASTESYDQCFPCWVSVDNKSSSKFTRVSVDVVDYPGLVRTIAWVLSGTEALVQHALISTEEDKDMGMTMAHDEFWVTSIKGKKLSDKAASFLQDRLTAFLIFCKPHLESASEWQSGSVRVSNNQHAKWTVVSVHGGTQQMQRPLGEGFFYEVTSLITSSGARIMAGTVLGPDSPPDAVVQHMGLGAHRPGGSDGPVYTFCVADEAGQKLGAAAVAALLYMCDISWGGSAHLPFAPPAQDNYVRSLKN